jgi:hypothetical protein
VSTQFIVNCSLAAYTVGWCALLGLIVVRSCRLAASGPLPAVPSADPPVRPHRDHCTRSASFNV